MKPANYAPMYSAAMYPQLAEIARGHGYALAVHGTLGRDMDLVCIPWVDGAKSPDEVVRAMVAHFSLRPIGEPEQKKHGRIAYTISVGFGECFLDLSFMPVLLNDET